MTDRLLSDRRPVAKKLHVCNAWPIIKDALDEGQVTFSFSDLRIIAKHRREGGVHVFIQEGEKHVHQTFQTTYGAITLYVDVDGLVKRKTQNTFYDFRAKEELHKICLAYDLYSTK